MTKKSLLALGWRAVHVSTIPPFTLWSIVGAFNQDEVEEERVRVTEYDLPLRGAKEDESTERPDYPRRFSPASRVAIAVNEAGDAFGSPAARPDVLRKCP